MLTLSITEVGGFKAMTYQTVINVSRKSPEKINPPMNNVTKRNLMASMGQNFNEWAYAMGIDWHMKDTELAEAIPTAYTRYIGKEFFKITK